MAFKKPDKHILVLTGLGGAAILASAGLAFWLYATSTTHKSVAAAAHPKVRPQTYAAETINAEHNRLGARTPHTPPSVLQPMPQAWDNVMAHINPAKPPSTTRALVALDTPKYISNAGAGISTPANAPKIAIVIDDVGVHGVLSKKASEVLPPEVTFSFLPYGSATLELAQKARKDGREVMIHLPMEPMPRLEEPPIDPGPDALYVELEAAEIKKRTLKNLALLKDMAVGVNNHMGSRFTAYEEGMQEVLKIIDAEGLFFLDSLTTNQSAVEDAAKKVAPHMPLLKRDVFLDHYITEQALTKALLKLEKEALANGHAIAIGHPHERTLRVLQDWLPTLPYKGIYLVPISHLLPKTPKEGPQAHVQPPKQQQPQPPVHIRSDDDPTQKTRLY